MKFPGHTNMPRAIFAAAAVAAIMLAAVNAFAQTPMVKWKKDSVLIAEEQGGVLLDFMLSTDPAADITVRIAVDEDATTAQAADYTLDTADYPVTPGEDLDREVLLIVTDDNEVESAELVVLEIQDGAGYSVGVPAAVTVTILDNDSAPVVTPDADMTVGEDAGVFTFTFTSEQVFENDVILTSLNPLIPNNAARAHEDYALDYGAQKSFEDSLHQMDIFFPAGTLTYGVVVTIIDDKKVEADETFKFGIEAANGQFRLLDRRFATITIVDNDVAGPTATFTAAMQTADEGAEVVLQIEMAQPAIAPTVFTFATSGDADASDFTIPPGVTFAAGDTTGELSIAITDDDAPELDEDLIVTMLPSLDETLYTRGEARAQTITIRGGDFTPDVNADDRVTASDGILIARYLLGVRDAGLTAAQTGAAADMVAQRVMVGEVFQDLDVDNENGVTYADGILIARYLLGLRDDSLTTGVTTAAAEVVTTQIKKLLGE